MTASLSCRLTLPAWPRQCPAQEPLEISASKRDAGGGPPLIPGAARRYRLACRAAVRPGVRAGVLLHESG